jgi:hypothetical protein
MSQDPISSICSVAGCSREAAELSFAKTGNVIDSIDALIAKTHVVNISRKRKRSLSPASKEIERIRGIMERADEHIRAVITESNQRASSESCVTQVPRAETAPQSSCSPGYPPPSPE